MMYYATLAHIGTHLAAHTVTWLNAHFHASWHSRAEVQCIAKRAHHAWRWICEARVSR